MKTTILLLTTLAVLFTVLGLSMYFGECLFKIWTAKRGYPRPASRGDWAKFNRWINGELIAPIKTERMPAGSPAAARSAKYLEAYPREGFLFEVKPQRAPQSNTEESNLRILFAGPLMVARWISKLF